VSAPAAVACSMSRSAIPCLRADAWISTEELQYETLHPTAPPTRPCCRNRTQAVRQIARNRRRCGDQLGVRIAEACRRRSRLLAPHRARRWIRRPRHRVHRPPHQPMTTKRTSAWTRRPRSSSNSGALNGRAGQHHATRTACVPARSSLRGSPQAAVAHPHVAAASARAPQPGQTIAAGIAQSPVQRYRAKHPKTRSEDQHAGTAELIAWRNGPNGTTRPAVGADSRAAFPALRRVAPYVCERFGRKRRGRDSNPRWSLIPILA
jgi:hypothetical protein